MHSRIMVLSSPINEDTDIGSLEPLTSKGLNIIEDWLVSNDIDYIRECEKTYWWEDLQWLCAVYPFIKLEDENGQYFLVFERKTILQYFEEKLNKLKDLVNNITAEDFALSYPKLYDIQQCVDNHYGFKIITVEEDGLPYDTYALDDYLRFVSHTDKVKVKVQGVLDYHY